MNYGKKGVRAKQKALNSKSQKWGRKLALTCVKIMLAAVVGIGSCRYRCLPRHPLFHSHDPAVRCRGSRRGYYRI